MNCCQCDGYDALWDAERAAGDVKRYRRKGPDKTTRLLIDALRAEGIDDASLLDIGAGVGVVHHELLSAGARSAIHVDATSANIRAAEDESKRRGHDGQVTFVRGDFTALAAEIPAADVVTLDRVICCYPDMESLVSASASKARRLYGAVFPRERTLNKAWVAVDNFVRRIRGKSFRSYVHSVRAIEAALERQGLRRSSTRETLVWRVVVYSR